MNQSTKKEKAKMWMRKVAPIVSAKIKRGEKVVVHGTRGTGPIETRGIRALARELGRSPSHICRVMHGERKSARLECRMRELGLTFEPATLRGALKRQGKGGK